MIGIIFRITLFGKKFTKAAGLRIKLYYAVLPFVDFKVRPVAGFYRLAALVRTLP